MSSCISTCLARSLSLNWWTVLTLEDIASIPDPGPLKWEESKHKLQQGLLLNQPALAETDLYYFLYYNCAMYNLNIFFQQNIFLWGLPHNHLHFNPFYVSASFSPFIIYASRFKLVWQKWTNPGLNIQPGLLDPAVAALIKLQPTSHGSR